MRSLRAVSRVSRRDAVRHPLALLLAVLIVAVPTAFLGYVLIREESRAPAFEISFAPPDETTATYIGGRCRQSTDGYTHDCTDPPDATDTRPQQEILLDVLPSGFSAQLMISGPATVESRTATAQTSMIQVDPSVSRAPGPGEIRLMTPLREQLGVVPGDTVTVTAEGVTVDVTVVSDTPGVDSLLSHPTVFDPATFRSSPTLWAVWHLDGDRPLTWDDVDRLNSVGFTVQGRGIRGDAPPSVRGLDGPPRDSVGQPLGILWSLAALVFGTMAALLAVQLLAPVFAVQVNRQSRTFALMAAQGAAPRHIIWAALTYGALAGLTGATAGLLTGGVVAVAVWPGQYPDWPVRIPWPGLLGLWFAAVVAAVAATLLPAWFSSRAGIVAGLSGATGDGIRRRPRWLWFGPGLLLFSLLIFGVSRLVPPPPNFGDLNWGSLASSVGGLTGFIGVTLTAAALVHLLGHRAPGPLPARIAAREMRRQPLRSVPAVAAVAAVVTLATSLMVQSDAYARRATAWEQQTYRPGVIAVPDSPRLEKTVHAVSEVVGPLTRGDVHGIGYDWTAKFGPHLVADPELVEPCSPGEPCGPPVWVPGPQSLFDAHVVIASPLLLDALSVPAPMPSGAAMLVSGDVETEEASFQLHRAVGDPLGEEVSLRVSPILPETVSDWMPTPEAFERFGVESEFLGVILIARGPLTPAVREELLGIDATIRTPGVPIPREPGSRFSITGLVILVVALTLALTVGRSRRRNAVLESVGASPRLPRIVSASVGGLLTLSGSVPGLIAGHAGVFLSSPTVAGHVTIDWWLILGLAVVAPAVAAAVGWVLTPRTVLPEDLRS